ncbi:hypothetical protein BDF19DRAFT_259825 [Syncephalis fuscata]|nr:hypothetical protein BDF19DRAFT_259825 [Syncephalis fuscata]
MLLDAGISINLPGENGWTPLHEALSQQHADACQYLLMRGADPLLKNEMNESALELARRYRLSDEVIAQCLGNLE